MASVIAMSSVVVCHVRATIPGEGKKSTFRRALTGYLRGVIYLAKAPHQRLDARRTRMCNTTATYTVEGMTCNSCVNKVTNAVTGVEGVLDVDVDVSDGTLEVSGHIDDAAIRDAVAQAGYKIAN